MTTPPSHLACRKRNQRNSTRKRQAGFSLVEIMIAIAILGFGLVMMATMFPIAWQRARTLVEFTSQAAAVESAHSAAKLLFHVDSPNSTVYEGSSFAGDLIEDPLGPVPYPSYPDQRVHLLHMENLLVSPRGFYPPRDDANGAASPPYKLEGPVPVTLPPVTTFFTPDYRAAQIRLEQRIYPPMPPRENVDAATGAFQSDDPTWDDTFASRRFAWVAFHRLLKPIPITGDVDTQCVAPGFALGCPDFLSQTREFDMYYATVKRSQVRTRYAQQDPNDPPNPDFPNDVKVPVALPTTDDVVLPTPWRVQIFIPNPSSPDPNQLANPHDESPKAKDIDADRDRAGVPTVAEVNTSNVPTASFVVDFFQRGTKFIDEVNGEIYEVVNRRTRAGTGPDDVQAFLTLDKEIVLVDIVDPSFPGPPYPTPQLVRTVWVFPPPVDSERLTDGSPIFIGSPPVIGIDKRILSVAP